MFRLSTPHNGIPADVTEFIALVNSLQEESEAQIRELFDGTDKLIISRAPGRLDVMGGIGDYSGSQVLQLPLEEATRVALGVSGDRTVKIISLGQGGRKHRTFEFNLSEFESEGKPIGYEQAQMVFSELAVDAWAAYVAGAFLVLMHEEGVSFDEGARILIESDVPEGKGVSSSAALEVAAMKAITAAYDINIQPEEIASYCQVVENRIVGAPCGIMDQMTSVFGIKDCLMSLLCQPAQLQGNIALPEEIHFWGIESGVEHSVSGTGYTSVRTGTFMGYRIIAEIAGLEAVAVDSSDRLKIEDDLWNGYLANISPAEFDEKFESHLPYEMKGAEFLEKYAGHTDPVTTIEPSTTYPVKIPTIHPVWENFRVRLFSELLRSKIIAEVMELLGELMYQAHTSYSRCGLGAEGTDQLVELVKEYGPGSGLYGAKITGGGSGGTVAIMGRPDSEYLIEKIASKYSDSTGHTPYIFRHSSSGVREFDHLELVKV